MYHEFSKKHKYALVYTSFASKDASVKLSVLSDGHRVFFSTDPIDKHVYEFDDLEEVIKLIKRTTFLKNTKGTESFNITFVSNGETEIPYATNRVKYLLTEEQIKQAEINVAGMSFLPEDMK